MAIKFGRNPFVNWRFLCKTPDDVIEKNKIASEKLNYYLAGFNAALVSIGRTANEYTITNDKLKRLKRGSNVFVFRPKVQRNPGGGGTDLASAKVPRPQQPDP
jgi:hypothetical protein